jgi:hypothetical protein
MNESAGRVLAFENGLTPKAAFSHARHVAVACAYLEHFGWERERHGSLRRFAARSGEPDKYHHTVTMAWLCLVQAARLSTPQALSDDEFAARHPELFAKGALGRYYSAELLARPEGRQRWIGPDRQPLPFEPNAASSNVTERPAAAPSGKENPT